MKMEIIDVDELKKEVEVEVMPTASQTTEIEKQAEENVKEIMALDINQLEEKRN